jgi:hypothetical protein
MLALGREDNRGWIQRGCCLVLVASLRIWNGRERFRGHKLMAVGFLTKGVMMREILGLSALRYAILTCRPAMMDEGEEYGRVLASDWAAACLMSAMYSKHVGDGLVQELSRWASC